MTEQELLALATVGVQNICALCGHLKIAHHALGPCGEQVPFAGGEVWECPCPRFHSLDEARTEAAA